MLKLKARIAPHENEKSLKSELRSDCSMSASMSVRILVSIAVLWKWRLSRVEAKSAFLQTGAAERSVHVIPRRKSADRFRFLWLLLTALYGLANANAKSQVQSDNLVLDNRLHQEIDVPQLFYQQPNENLQASIAKTANDILVTGKNDVVDQLLESINSKFKFREVVHGTIKLRHFGFSITQHQDRACTIDNEEKLLVLEASILTCLQRKVSDDKLNKFEMSALATNHGALEWLGTTVSPFCSVEPSWLHHRLPDVHVFDLIKKKILSESSNASEK